MILKRSILAAITVLGLFLALIGCNSSDISAIDDSVSEPDPKPIDTSKLGINAFANDSRFGSIGAQFLEVRDTLHIPHIRVLFAWNDAVQKSPGSSPNFSFYDSIMNGVPSGVDVDILMDGLPSWMSDSKNWIGGDPRETFAQKWVQPVVKRYGGNGHVVAFEMWNEPNQNNADNTTMGFVNNPQNYVAFLMRAHDISKATAPSKLVLNAATTSINQDFDTTLDYNRAMRDAGATTVVDRWNIHYYGKEYANVEQDGGVADFLNGLSLPVWVTESGAQGVNNQLDYGKRVWPFLIDQIPSIERIYIYQFTEATDPTVTYGLRNLSQNFPVSDLYIYLRNGAG